MSWDLLILIAAIALVIAGWNTGLINSWRSPLAIIIATLTTQQYYVDFSTWIVQQTLMQPAQGSLLGYLMMWIVIEIVAEVSLSLFLGWNRREPPKIWERAGGALLGLIKCVIAIIFPLMVLQSPPKIPAPPPECDARINPFEAGFTESQVVKIGSGLAKDWAPSLSGIVLSTKTPSFKPKFPGPPSPANKILLDNDTVDDTKKVKIRKLF